MRILKYIALAIFCVSFLLPAYVKFDITNNDVYAGWECFLECIALHHSEFKYELGYWVWYYHSFVVTNLLFLIMLSWSFLIKNETYFLVWLSLIPRIHVLSWLIVNIYWIEEQDFEIRYGYYVWLMAYAILTVTVYREAKINRAKQI